MKKTHLNNNLNQKGVTLVELLAVLVLISLVTGIIWTTINISVRHNAIETTKTQLQQEANFIITKLQAIHREKDCYVLAVTKNEIKIDNCINQKADTEILSNSFLYSFEVLKDGKYHPITKKVIEPKLANLSNVKLTVTEPGNDKLSITVESSITRYMTKEGGAR